MSSEQLSVDHRDTEQPGEAVSPAKSVNVNLDVEIQNISGNEDSDLGSNASPMDSSRGLRRMDTPSQAVPDTGKQATLARKKQAEKDGVAVELSCLKRVDRLLKIDLQGLDKCGEPDRPKEIMPSSSEFTTDSSAEKEGSNDTEKAKGSSRPGTAESGRTRDELGFSFFERLVFYNQWHEDPIPSSLRNITQK